MHTTLVCLCERVSSSLWKSSGSKLRECHPHRNDFTNSETKHEKEGVKDRARKAKEEVTTSIKGHDFFSESLFLHRFLPLPSSLIFLYCNMHPYLGEGKVAVWTKRGICSHAFPSTPPREAGRGREEWHGHEWENILAFSMGLLIRSFGGTGSHREDTTTKWKIKKGPGNLGQ